MLFFFFRRFFFPDTDFDWVNAVKILTFLGKNWVSEWKCCFFFSGCCFFSGDFFWVSEWILNFSWEKKNKMAKIGKFGPEKKNSFRKKNSFARNRVSEWGLNFSREKKIRYLWSNQSFWLGKTSNVSVEDTTQVIHWFFNCILSFDPGFWVIQGKNGVAGSIAF